MTFKVRTKGHVGFSSVKLGRKNISDREKSLANPRSGLIEEACQWHWEDLNQEKSHRSFWRGPGGQIL